MKMQKINEDGSYNFSDTQIKSVPSHINPQDQNVHENIIDSAIEDLNEKWVNAPVEGSGWVLHSLTEGIVVIVATHKCMIPINSGSVGTWCPLPKGLRGRYQIKNLVPNSTTNYNCLEACIHLHLSSKVDPQILEPAQGVMKYRYSFLWNNYPAFRDVRIKFPPFENKP